MKTATKDRVSDQQVAEQAAEQSAEQAAEQGELSAEAFKAIFRHHPGGVAFITAHTGDRHVALTASSLTSLSAEPPMLMFSVSSLSSSFPIVAECDTVAIHMIDADTIELAKLGAASGADRFADPERWTELPTGERVFPEASVWIRARIEQRIELGTATVCVVRALESSLPSENPGETPRGDQLAYVDRTWHRLGSGSRID